MEGWFWRITDVRGGVVVVALCGINRHAGGDWATVAVAVHPGQVVRSGAFDGARASATVYDVVVPGVLDAGPRRLRVELDELVLDVAFEELVGWPHRLRAGGLFSALPYLGQYWQPHVLGGRVQGTVTVAGTTRSLDGAELYAEKNWGSGFPARWWWGQAQGFDRADVCVAFGGGRLTAGRIGHDVTGCVLRIGADVVRFAPPLSRVSASVRSGRWHVSARRRGWRVELDGDGDGAAPFVLPVPVPAERRNVDQDLEHLAARLRLRVWRHGTLILDEVSALAALEVGSTDPHRAADLFREHGAPSRTSAGRTS